MDLGPEVVWERFQPPEESEPVTPTTEPEFQHAAKLAATPNATACIAFVCLWVVLVLLMLSGCAWKSDLEKWQSVAYECSETLEGLQGSCNRLMRQCNYERDQCNITKAGAEAIGKELMKCLKEKKKRK